MNKIIMGILMAAIISLSGCVDTTPTIDIAIVENITIIEVTDVIAINTTDIIPEITQVDNYNNLFIPKGNLLNNYEYADNSCEIIARTFQKEYNGHMVFVAPLKISSGAWIRSRYGGHWLNQIYYNNKTIFIDYNLQRIYYDEITLHDDMQYSMQNKFNSDDIDVKIYIAGIDVMPYNMAYN